MRSGSLFVTVSQRQKKNGKPVMHVAKAHACSVCHGILVSQQERDKSIVETISQQEYNELPEVRDIPIP